MIRLLDGQALEHTPATIQKQQIRLSRINSKDDASENGDRLDGTAVFEGIATRVKPINESWIEIEIDVINVIFGTTDTNLLIVTPVPERYGIEFQTGKKYKILALIIDGTGSHFPWIGARYATMSWLGTYQITVTGSAP